MARYFKVTEITQKEFVDATGERLGWYTQITAPVEGNVFVAVDDSYEDEFCVSIDHFDEDGDSDV